MLSSQGYQRKRMGMASFLDVIFLLLFYVIMTSTFSRFGEVTLTSAGAGQKTAEATETQSDAPKPYFLQLGLENLRLNGEELLVEDLREKLEESAAGTAVLIKLAPEVTAQRLTDLLVVLNGLPALSATVLE